MWRWYTSGNLKPPEQGIERWNDMLVQVPVQTKGTTPRGGLGDGSQCGVEDVTIKSPAASSRSMRSTPIEARPVSWCTFATDGAAMHNTKHYVVPSPVCTVGESSGNLQLRHLDAICSQPIEGLKHMRSHTPVSGKQGPVASPSGAHAPPLGARQTEWTTWCTQSIHIYAFIKTDIKAAKTYPWHKSQRNSAGTVNGNQNQAESDVFPASLACGGFGRDRAWWKLSATIAVCTGDQEELATPQDPGNSSYQGESIRFTSSKWDSAHSLLRGHKDPSFLHLPTTNESILHGTVIPVGFPFLSVIFPSHLPTPALLSPTHADVALAPQISRIPLDTLMGGAHGL
ncbi:hypothetical protein N7492_000710 [Penicillium capsulatum]|uniref:Uncharacterized protein n=1 Tax=Penicillium capsulatum TaxID=69766 RepID=A0A9W9ISA8_9EURO|nr:hypothetical protein N7492_000710 [Penicillium capsulatum]KAJ6130232.1 hypothetical protein N7512_003012 [Penicillium capsulatum]